MTPAGAAWTAAARAGWAKRLDADLVIPGDREIVAIGEAFARPQLEIGAADVGKRRAGAAMVAAEQAKAEEMHVFPAHHRLDGAMRSRHVASTETSTRRRTTMPDGSPGISDKPLPVRHGLGVPAGRWPSTQCAEEPRSDPQSRSLDKGAAQALLVADTPAKACARMVWIVLQGTPAARFSCYVGKPTATSTDRLPPSETTFAPVL